MTVLATFVGGWGHAEPLVPIAAVAMAHGHDVTFIGQREVLPRLTALGFPTLEVGPDTLGPRRRPLVAVDREAERVVVRDHFVGEFGAFRAEALGAVFADRRPQAVVCDEMDVGAVVAAEQLGIPCVTVAVTAAGRLSGPDVVGPAWDGLRAGRGVAADPHGERLVGALGVAPFPRSFRDPAVPWPSALHAVRPPILDAVEALPAGTGRRRAGDRPFVYVTLGTVFNIESGDLLPRLVDAMGHVAADVLMTTGPHIGPEELAPRPPNVDIEQFVPQHEVLGRCRAVVSHGGSGTLLAALSLGVPVVVLPMGADQPDNADRCTELGVGVVLDPLTVTPGEIADAVAAVLGEDRYLRAAGELATDAAAQPRLADLPELRRLLER